MQKTLRRVTEAAADEATANYDDTSDALARYATELSGRGDGGYVVLIDGNPVGAVWRDPSVPVTYWGAWKGTGRVMGESRREVVEAIVAVVATRRRG